ncbi:hypothetical protein BWD42_21735 [Sphingobacterium sp. CZ-UAM]|uniref:hypothetical protein n=1 Tax=Sphingobacterium sp. CZ-UAM TaxID=1933868 RepID=UPI0009850FAB|nr:hypothetical protein [Sphingobacterium sp. CZ-UAM]OOG16360.1 hypothetical protein BWD42_21735 [Sphingobacterium sp. CZ-UAM]
MKQLIFTIVFASVYSLNYGQTTVKESKASNGVPIMFVDSVRIGQADLQKYKSEDIATVTVYKDSTKFKHLDSNAIGAIYIETNQFSRKRFLNYFKSKSPEFKTLLASQQNDDSFQYVLNGEVLSKNYEGKLAAIDDKKFKSITIIRKEELVDKYGATDKTFGIVIVSDVPKDSPNVKK